MLGPVASTKRPRPPGVRRASAAPFATYSVNSSPNRNGTKDPHHTDLKHGQIDAKPANVSPLAISKLDSRITKTNETSFISPHKLRSRPLSILSESSFSASAPSPPPPYRRGSMISPQDSKRTSMNSTQPPPSLDSGPSSARTSLMSCETVEDMIDETHHEDGKILTLRGVQRLIQQHDMDSMAAELNNRLVVLGSSPGDPLSPRSAAEARLTGRSLPHFGSPLGKFASSYTSLPEQGSITSKSKGRQARNRQTPSGFELRQSLQRAEEDEARILELEAQLADAKDSEEAQRKATARLRRDIEVLRRQLQHAEEGAASERSQTESLRAAVMGERGRRHVSLPLDAARLRASQKSQPDDDRLGWGSTTFPEFPRDDFSDTGASERTARGPRSSSRDDSTSKGSPFAKNSFATLLPFSLTTKSDNFGDEGSTGAAYEQPTAASSGLSSRSRPAVSLSTFLKPENLANACGSMHSLASSPETSRSRSSSVSSGEASSPCKRSASRVRRGPYTDPHQIALPVSEIGSEGGTGPRRRTSSFTSSCSHDSVRSHTSATSAKSSATVFSGISVTPLSGLVSRAESVRSFVSDYLGVRRSLGSELGSSYEPSPTIPQASLFEGHMGEGEDSGDYLTDAQTSETDFEGPARLSFTASKPASHSFAESNGRYHAGTVKHKSRRSLTLSPTAQLATLGPLASVTEETVSDGISDNRVSWADWSPGSSPSPAPRDAASTFNEQIVTIPPSVYVDVPTPGREAQRPTTEGLVPPETDEAQSPAGLTHLVPSRDPWDEYSDRCSILATPSPARDGHIITPSPHTRAKALRPLYLCTSPAVHARSNSLAQAAADRRRARAMAARHSREYPQTFSQRRAELLAAPSTEVAITGGYPVTNPPGAYPIGPHARNGSIFVFHPRAPWERDSAPVTIPGRIMHDIFCILLLILDYMEWIIIISYRLFVDIRAGPAGTLGDKRRSHRKRFYI